MKKILQIIPANGWVAKFKNVDGTGLKDDLVCFALIEEDGDTHVEGLCSGDYIELCENIDNFVGYEKR